MTPHRPYLIRALREWILDNDMTPHLLVNANQEGVSVPDKYIDDGKIVLNIAPGAIQDLELGNEWIMFSARFSGVSHRIELPVKSVLAVYALENGRGMVLPDEPEYEQASDSDSSDKQVADENKDGRPARGKPHLKVIK